MKFHLKAGVSSVGIRAELVVALMVAESVYEEFGSSGRVVPSLCGEREDHQDGSLHFVGLAADLRVNADLEGGLPYSSHQDLRNRLNDELGDDWDVIYEYTHIHIEFQPKRETN